MIVDLQAYYLDDGIYKSCYRAGTVYNYEKSHVLPLSSIELEGETFSAPGAPASHTLQCAVLVTIMRECAELSACDLNCFRSGR